MRLRGKKLGHTHFNEFQLSILPLLMSGFLYMHCCKSRYENPQKLTQLSPRHLVGGLLYIILKRRAQKRRHQKTSPTTARWTAFSHTGGHRLLKHLTSIFTYFYITRITTTNGTPHLKPPRNQNRRAALGQPAIKLLGASTSLRHNGPAYNRLPPQTNSVTLVSRS